MVVQSALLGSERIALLTFSNNFKCLNVFNVIHINVVTLTSLNAPNLLNYLAQVSMVESARDSKSKV